MSRGFITIGIDTEDDRIKYSYALALSIKQCDPDSEFCLVVDKDASDKVPEKYHHAFDYIVELPFGNTAYKDGFHGMNLWQLLHCSPFEETIYVDSDTMFKNINIETLWDQFETYDLAISSIARTYRDYLTNKVYRFEIEMHYELPQLYNNLIYFKRDSQLAIEWFKMADPVFQNWRQVYQTMFKEKKPLTFDKNLLANITTHLCDIENLVSCPINNLYDFHNLSQRHWGEDIPENWTDMLNYWYTDQHKLMIENSVVNSGIIHYQDENFLTEDIIDAIKAVVEISDRRNASA
jgi:hypothetical protein